MIDFVVVLIQPTLIHAKGWCILFFITLELTSSDPMVFAPDATHGPSNRNIKSILEFSVNVAS